VLVALTVSCSPQVNYYKMSADTNMLAYHYDVRFQPEMPNKRKMWMLWMDAVKKGAFGNVVYV
jgi:hypothetical protein